jgi:lipoprotein-anchoring transpeptidase ErfK/SrfK
MKKIIAAFLVLAVSMFAFVDLADARKKRGSQYKRQNSHQIYKVKKKKRAKHHKVALPAAVRVSVDISSQRMNVVVNGASYATWTVSTGRQGFATPTGSYSVKRMARTYYSRKYDNAPMPYSVFFNGGFAIHGTSHIRQLGRPASHGCVRLAPGNAATLFALVQKYGARRTRISLSY